MSTRGRISTDTSTAHGQILAYDLDEGRVNFGRAPVALRHTLSDHPLFTQEALAELADELPIDKVEHNLGTVDAVVPDGEVPQLDLSPGEIVRGIDTNGCWIVLPELVNVPRYRALYDRILEDLRPLVGDGRNATSGYHSVIFMAAPGSVTPSHIDPEMGFLLHLRGDKRISVGRFENAEVERAELESFHRGGHRNTELLPVDAERFDLEPGDGVHVPSLVPHWVENGDAVAVSLSIGFQTPWTTRRCGVYMWNSRVRRLGLSPKPYGESARRDRIKASLLWSAVRARRAVRRAPE